MNIDQVPVCGPGTGQNWEANVPSKYGHRSTAPAGGQRNQETLKHLSRFVAKSSLTLNLVIEMSQEFLIWVEQQSGRGRKPSWGRMSYVPGAEVWRGERGLWARPFPGFLTVDRQLHWRCLHLCALRNFIGNDTVMVNTKQIKKLPAIGSNIQKVVVETFVFISPQELLPPSLCLSLSPSLSFSPSLLSSLSVHLLLQFSSLVLQDFD